VVFVAAADVVAVAAVGKLTPPDWVVSAVPATPAPLAAVWAAAGANAARDSNAARVVTRGAVVTSRLPIAMAPPISCDTWLTLVVRV
jgi:hypothetical protein